MMPGEGPIGSEPVGSAPPLTSGSYGYRPLRTASAGGEESADLYLPDAIRSAGNDVTIAVLEAAGERAMRRDGERQASIGLLLIIQGALSVGLTLSREAPSSARWLVDAVEAQSASPSALLELGRGPALSVDQSEILLRPAAWKAIRMARALAQATIGTDQFDTRHLLVAALDSPDLQIRRELGAGAETIGVDLAELRNHIVRRVVEAPGQNENMEIWRKLLSERDTVWAEIMPSAANPVRRSSTISGFAADRPSHNGADPLGIQADVSAFARLICLEEATPPLSIGLFGEWGSGKSSFMERLQGEIATLTKTERDARKTGDARRARLRDEQGTQSETPGHIDPGPRFVENVVQIRFNAWHFADANLWASLTAEFFDQLRRGGHDGLRSRDYLGLVGKVADRVRSLEASAQKADGAVTAAIAAAKKAGEALAEAREKLAASDLSLASAHLGKALEEFQKKNAVSLKDVGTRVYRTDLSTDIDGLKAAVSEASTIPGKILLVSRILAGGGAATWLGALSVVLFAVIGVMWRYGDPTSLAVLVQRAIGWGGGTLAALGALWQALAKVRPVLDGAWEYAKAVEAARKQLAAEVEVKEEAAASASGALAAAKTEAEKAKAPLAQYGQGAATSAPATILRYFLFEDGDVRDYDKHVGLVSRARRSFEQLDAIVAAGRDGTAARAKKANGQALTEAEVAALERFEAMQLGDRALNVPDRIVLYIDDLDRCTHQQVYDVLQAIHLLLAFELFVVVVGVDVGWVEQAVARQFASSDMPGSQETSEKREARDRRRAIDYLEKIFQLPFWLRPLSIEGDGASYGAYVRGLLQANLEATGDSPLAPPEHMTRTKAATGSVEGLTDSVLAPDKDMLDGVDFEETGSLDNALATVRLKQEEVDFLSSPEIGALAAKSPRAVKRMINVYRIIRARMGEAELAEFLGETHKPPTWPIAVLLAAVECGQPLEVADAIYRGLQTTHSWEKFETLSIETILNDQKGTLRDATGKDAFEMADMATGNMLALATDALARARRTGDDQDSETTIGDMLAVARIVRRYSFNRYH